MQHTPAYAHTCTHTQTHTHTHIQTHTHTYTHIHIHTYSHTHKHTHTLTHTESIKVCSLNWLKGTPIDIVFFSLFLEFWVLDTLISFRELRFSHICLNSNLYYHFMSKKGSIVKFKTWAESGGGLNALSNLWSIM